MAALKASLEEQQQLAAETGDEVGTLRHCLLRMTRDDKEKVDYESEGGVVEENVAKDSSNGEVTEEEGEEEEEKKRNAQLMRIEALLNTTKVRA